MGGGGIPEMACSHSPAGCCGRQEFFELPENSNLDVILRN